MGQSVRLALISAATAYALLGAAPVVLMPILVLDRATFVDFGFAVAGDGTPLYVALSTGPAHSRALPALPKPQAAKPGLSRTPPAPADTDPQVNELSEGWVACVTAQSMRVNTWSQVVVRAAEAIGPWIEQLDDPLIRPRPLLVGPDMMAELSGPDFNIIRAGGDDGRRVLSPASYAEWQWHVQPLRSGELYLIVTLYMRMTDNGSPALDVQSIRVPARVQVNAPYSIGHWLKDYWPATGLTVPIVISGIVVGARQWRQQRAKPHATAKRNQTSGQKPLRTSQRRPLRPHRQITCAKSQQQAP